MKTCKIKSYAKINLYLGVFKKRKDNYHRIITLFERINLCDEIYLKPRPDKKIRIICNNSRVPKGKANLAYRAASLLRRDFAINNGLDIKIIKRIPLAAGLAGGSSNAASVLLVLNRLWNLNLNRKKLLCYGKMLGMDVPFFLVDTSFAVGRGRGDEIRVLGALKKRFWHILIVPKLKVSTKAVYNRLDKIFKPSDTGLTKATRDVKLLGQRLKRGKIPLIRKSLFNRLQMATFNLYPSLKQLNKMLLNLGRQAILMSGSGPAMFGIVSSRKEASILCRKLSSIGNCDMFIARTR